MTTVVFHCQGEHDRIYRHHSIVVGKGVFLLFKDGSDEPAEPPEGEWACFTHDDDWEPPASA